MAAFELEQAGRRLALEPDEPVRIVLEDGEVVLAHDLDESGATLRRERPPARVLERRDRVEERRPVAVPSQLRFERVGVETLLVHLEGDDLGALASEDLQRPVVARSLDEHASRSARELLRRVEREALQAADGEDDALRRHAVPLGDPLAERRVPATRAVREHPRAVALRDRVRAVGELVRRDELRRRRAAGKGDRRAGHAFEPMRRRCRRRSTAARSNRGGVRRSSPAVS